MYSEIFEVDHKYSPITDYPSNPVPIHDITQIPKKPPRELSSQIIKPFHKYHSLLHKLNMTNCQLSPQELINLMHLLCEF